MKKRIIMTTLLSAVIALNSIAVPFMEVCAEGEFVNITEEETDNDADESDVAFVEETSDENDGTVSLNETVSEDNVDYEEDETDEEVHGSEETADDIVDDGEIISGKTSSGIEYELASNGLMTITGYSGTSGTLNIPKTIDGYEVRVIAEGAFEGNKTITSATIPEGVEKIGDRSFKDCTMLVDLTINAKEMGDKSSYCVNWGQSDSRSHCVFYNAGSTKGMNVTFGNTVRRIPAYLFATDSKRADGYYCRINKLIISDSVTEIGSYAFANCHDLSLIQGGGGLLAIYNNAFVNDSLTIIPSSFISLLEIGKEAFVNNTSLTTVNLPESLESIGDAAFKDCTGITDINYNAKYLGNKSSYCVNWGQSDSKSHSVFYNAGSSLGMTVTFGNTVKRIPSYLFATDSGKSDGYYCKLSKIIISDSVTEIGDYTFGHCWRLSQVQGGSGLLTLSGHAFYGTALSSYPVSFKNLEDIGTGAFAENTEMLEAIVGEHVANIGNEAFAGNSSLKNVVLPYCLEVIGGAAFKNCIALTEMTINSKCIGDESSYSVKWGKSDSQRYSVFYNAGSSKGMAITFSEGVERIPAYFFGTDINKGDGVEYCKISEVIIPATVTEIGKYAFYDCHKLTKITFNGDAPAFGENCLGYVEATAYYPGNYSSWTPEKRQDYGGTITWEAIQGSVIHPTSITLDQDSIDLQVGSGVFLHAYVMPSNATNKNLIWSSSNENIVTVSDDGYVYGVAKGTAIITVETEDVGLTASCQVTVLDNSTPAPGPTDDTKIISLKYKKGWVTGYVTFKSNNANENSFYHLNKSDKKAILNKMTKRGYTFKGWYLNGRKVKSITPKLIIKNRNSLILEARFVPKTYKVKYVITKPAKGVKVRGKIKLFSNEKKVSYEGGTITARGTELSAYGYYLAGWSTVKGSSYVDIAVGETKTVDELLPYSGTTIRLYPVWR